MSACVFVGGGDDGEVVGVEIVTEVFDTSWRHLQILVNRCWKLLSDFPKIVFERKNCNVRCHQITYLSGVWTEMIFDKVRVEKGRGLHEKSC